MAAASSSSSVPSSSPPPFGNRCATYSGTLRILTVNDVYSAAPVAGVGGWAALSTLLQRHRTPHSITCINGDFLGGSALAEHFKGRNVVTILNQLQTDVVVVGNHECEFGMLRYVLLHVRPHASTLH